MSFSIVKSTLTFLQTANIDIFQIFITSNDDRKNNKSVTARPAVTLNVTETERNRKLYYNRTAVTFYRRPGLLSTQQRFSRILYVADLRTYLHVNLSNNQHG